MEPHRPTPRPSRLGRRALRALSAALIASVLVVGIAWAWSASTVNTASVAAGSLGTPASPAAVRTTGTGNQCLSITVSWNAVANATSYQVERNVTGTWTTIATSNATTSYLDSGSWTNYEIQYRITAKLGNWLSATPAIAALACGIGDVDDLAGTFSTNCKSTSLTWTVPLGTITSYNLERNIDGAGWVAVASGTGITGTSFNDTAQYTPAHGDIQYRISARNGVTVGNPSNLFTATTDYGCLVPPTNVNIAGCTINSKTLTWTAAPSPVTEYTVSRKVGAAAFANAATNVAGTTWTDTASHAAGTLVEYGLYSENGTLVDTILSGTDSLNSGFYVKTVVFGNTGTLGTLNPGDTVVVTFSQPVAAGDVTSQNINTFATGGGTRGAYLATTATGVTAATSDIMRITTSANNQFSTGNAAGTATFNADRTVWTWVANAGVPAITHAAGWAGTMAAGTSATRAQCGGNNLLTTPTPTFSGRW